MLLLHQTGTVKVGEVVRYTITYTPSEDRILPCPAALFVKIRNTAALPLRAAYLHGPYTLHTSSYPASFDPNAKLENPGRVGVPQFEPHVKAGGSWIGRLTVPDDIRTTFGGPAAAEPAHNPSSLLSSPTSVNSVTWIVEVASQILFSQSASVSYELLVSRDEKSLDFGLVSAMTSPIAAESRSAIHNTRRAGIYSEAIHLEVEDTPALWNKPALSDFCHKIRDDETSRNSSQDSQKKRKTVKRRKNIHLVMLTHGLHSNVGADMLFLKESIDAAAKQAKEDRRKRKSRQASNSESIAENGVEEREGRGEEGEMPPSLGTDTAQNSARDEEEDEDIIVRGFHENAVRTEKGIQYLGKRLAKYILQMTYPDQPFLPAPKSVTKKFSNRLTNGRIAPSNHNKAAKTSSSSSSASSSGGGTKSTSQAETAERNHKKTERLAYKFTSISFIGHSLGGLIQTYAVAYIQKHSPAFFDLIKPVNFIALATPMLGLSNENPVYIKFALDFGLVGRTGQDLGLFWRPPTFARSGWGAMVGNFGGNKQQKQKQQQGQQGQQDPRAKPLLRILPTGPAHQVLKRFRNRTLYCNAVNDGIVPLRTSCLLFLDWRGLERVQKARRDNGLIGTVAGWGWNEITGFNSATRVSRNHSSANSVNGELSQKDGDEVPQPPEGVTSLEGESEAAAMGHSQDLYPSAKEGSKAWAGSATLNNPIYAIWNLLRPTAKTTEKDYKMYRRSQTMALNSEIPTPSSRQSEEPEVAGVVGNDRKRPLVTKGDSYTFESKGINAPPKTTVFESARDLLSPSIPSTSWLIDPSQRDRTIFHDRVYHPDDIPPPPPAHKKSAMNFHYLTPNNETSDQAAKAAATDLSAVNNNEGNNPSSMSTGSIKVEEKIARAYHRDMAWRKVLVRLEPDAHNNIIVRRMFSNAYGWPVVKHLCDTHFADTYAAATSDELEPTQDRVNIHNDTRGLNGEEVKGQSSMQAPERTLSESREATDELKPLGGIGRSLSRSARLHREDSAVWNDADFEETSDDDDDNEYLERRSILLRWSSEDHGSSQSGEIRLNYRPQDNTPQISDQIVQSPSSMVSGGILENGLIDKTEEDPLSQSAGQEEDHNLQKSADVVGIGPNRTFTDILGPSSTANRILDSQSEMDVRADAPSSNAVSSRQD